MWCEYATGFRSTAVNPLLPHQYRASDHLAAKSRAVVMVQLKNRVHLGFGVANARLEEAREPLQYHQSLLIADWDFEQTVAVEKVVENFPFGVARLRAHGQPGEIDAAENRAADFSEHFFVQAIPAEVAVRAHLHQLELLEYGEMMRNGRLLQIEHRGELLNAMLGRREQTDHLEAALVGHRLAELQHDFGRPFVHCGWPHHFDAYLIRCISNCSQLANGSRTGIISFGVNRPLICR